MVSRNLKVSYVCLLAITFFSLMLGNNLALARPSAQVKSTVTRAENTDPDGQGLFLPYAFSSELTGFVLGVGGMRKGYRQDQMTIGGAAFAGEETRAAFAGVWDYRLPKTERLFFTAAGMIGAYPQQRAYAAPRTIPIPPDVVRPGANESSSDSFLESQGKSNWIDLKLEYVLPIGAASERGMVAYRLEEGLLVSEGTGGDIWNPLESGVSVIDFRSNHRYQSYVLDDQTLDGEVNSFGLGLLYDNTDFPTNPAKGSSQYISIQHDPGSMGSREEWSFIEFEASKYFSLGDSNWAKQRIIALNVWTAYSPSWEEEALQSGTTIVNGPPFLEGATLGGFYRMRGYRSNRFHDKAVVYGTAEYRYTLNYNPLKNVKWLSFLNIDWFQVVGFAEVGRVAPEYKADVLFNDMKTDVGVSLRALSAGIIIRLEMAKSEEDTNMWMMVGHPF